ncbi:MAG: rhodanese-like domain-containing protein [Spirochaetes bacterium]|nr:rhodanese-like domain-containing protein [Spirochaetota bacterium]
MKNANKYLLLSVLALAVLLAGCGRGGPVPVSTAAGVLSEVPSGGIISADQLRSLVDNGDPELVLIGVINPTAALVPFSTAARPIEGSYLVWRGDYSGENNPGSIAPEISGFRNSQQDMEDLLSRAGVTMDSRIVVYAADAMHDAARFVFQLRMLGLENNVYYLDGGINAWIAAGHPTGRGTRLSGVAHQSDFRAPSYTPERFDATMYQVVEALRNPDEWIVIDTRTQAEFEGRRTGSSSGAFGTGRIRGAVHIDWSEALDNNVIRPREELERIFEDVIAGRNVIVFCQSGVRSAHTQMVLTDVLGIENVLNYDGSWIEWSFAASSASGGRWPEILELTEEWSDNGRPI